MARGELAAGRRGSGLPNPEQRLLLAAALLPGEPARAAYRAWSAAVALDDVDPGSFRLLPLLAHNLADLAEPDLVRARGVVRHTWSKNQRMLARGGVAVAALAAAGVPVMVLGGAALVPRHYPSAGHRPMNDLDVLVPGDRAGAARDAIAACGWRPVLPLLPSHLPHLHRVAYTDGAGCAVDLHWHALPACRGEDEAMLWENAEPLTTPALAASAPHPTELVLLTAAGALGGGTPPPVQWAADLYRVLAVDAARVDWERLVRAGERLGCTLRLARSLGFVAAELGAPVPATALAALAAARHDRGEVCELGARAALPGAARGLLVHWLDHARLHPDESALRRLRTFPARLAAIWGLPSPAAVPAAALRRVVARLRRQPPHGSTP